MKKVLVFGIFDRLHPGHTNFLKQARKHGDFLVVAVGRASACRQIKCKTPRQTLKARISALNKLPYVNRAVAGDVKQGTYKIVLREKPDVICLGYDQKVLAADLKKWLLRNKLKIKTKILMPYKPDKYHTSLLV